MGYMRYILFPMGILFVAVGILLFPTLMSFGTTDLTSFGNFALSLGAITPIILGLVLIYAAAKNKGEHLA